MPRPILWARGLLWACLFNMQNIGNLHASCVAYRGKGLLILGPSGAGKSALALQLIAQGADLIADDRTDVFLKQGAVFAKSPPHIHGLIEARHLGILRLIAQPETQLHAVVDLGLHQTDRLPPLATRDILGVNLDLIHGSDYMHFPAALMCYLAGTRAE